MEGSSLREIVCTKPDCDEPTVCKSGQALSKLSNMKLKH